MFCLLHKDATNAAPATGVVSAQQREATLLSAGWSYASSARPAQPMVAGGCPQEQRQPSELGFGQILNSRDREASVV